MIIPITHYEAIMKLEIMNTSLIKKIDELFDGEIPDFITFCEAMRLKSKTSLLDVIGIMSENPYSGSLLVYSMSFHVWRFRENGEKLFYINNDICKMISNTKLTINSDFIESPFESIYIYTDQTDIKLEDKTGVMPMKGMYIHLRRERDGVKKLRFLATSGADGIDKMRDVNHYASFHIPDGEDADKICEDGIKKFFESFEKTGQKSTVGMDVVRNLYKFAVGALIYIGCRNANFVNIIPEKLDDKIKNLKNPKKIRRINKEFDKRCKMPFIWVGHKTHYPNPGYLGSGKKLDHSVLVSGHWRGQWYGPRDGERRKSIIRIDSYTKGKKYAPGEKKTYILKE